MPYLTGRAPTAQEAIAAIEDALDQRTYSGTLVIRTSPALHARLAIEAAEQRVSMDPLDSSEAGRSVNQAAASDVSPSISGTFRDEWPLVRPPWTCTFPPVAWC